MKHTFYSHRTNGLISVCSALLLLALSSSVHAEEWARVTKGLVGDSFKDVVFDQSHPKTLYAASGDGHIYKSINGGANWVDRSAGLPATPLTSITVDPNNGNVYVGTKGSGVYFSANGGDSWSTSGLSGKSVSELAVKPGNPSMLYAGTESGLYFGYSMASGTTSWVPTLAGKWVYSIAVSPSPSNYIYAGVLDPTDKSGKLFRSANSVSWVEIDSGLSGTLPLAIAIDPASPATVYVGTFSGDIPSATNGIYKSTNNGSTWTKLTLPSTRGGDGYPVSALAVAPGTVYGATAGPHFAGYMLWKSQDGGASWIRSSASGVMLNKLVVSPISPLIRFIATETGSALGSIGGLMRSVVKNDFDGDGKSDIFIQNDGTNDISVRIMDGTKMLSIAAVEASTLAWKPKLPWRLVATGDFDGDGLADPVMQNTSNSNQYAVWFISRDPVSARGNMATYRKTGELTFSGAGFSTRLVGVGDFDGDGMADLFWEIGINLSHSVWLNDGQNTWPLANRVPFTSWAKFVGSQDGFRAAAVGDFNGDMYADILLSCSPSPVCIWTGSDGYQGVNNIGSLPGSLAFVGVGDYNGDGNTDLLWKDIYNGQFNVWFMNGTTKLGESGPIGSSLPDGFHVGNY